MKNTKKIPYRIKNLQMNPKFRFWRWKGTYSNLGRHKRIQT